MDLSRRNAVHTFERSFLEFVLSHLKNTIRNLVSDLAILYIDRHRHSEFFVRLPRPMQDRDIELQALALLVSVHIEPNRRVFEGMLHPPASAHRTRLGDAPLRRILTGLLD